MNNPFFVPPLAPTAAPLRIVWIRLFVVGLLATGVVSCRRKEIVQVHLQTQSLSGPDTHRLEVRAQVAGAQAGLRYKWIADFGQCDPQESEWPSTMFRFAEGVKRDAVTVEVWRDGARVAHERIDLVMAEPRPRTPSAQLPAVKIELTEVPPEEPHGGPDTRATIAGKVSGEIGPDQKIVLYARADEAWYMQPGPYFSLTIPPDHTWSSWTHTGSHYAALVVRTGFSGPVICDVLPQVGGDVLARVIVEGVKK